MSIFRELYDYREMIYMLVRREIRGRYKGSVLGFFWTFLNPLLQFVVYAVVFSVLLRSDIEKFYAYLFIAFIPWFFNSTTILQGATCIHAQSSMVQKIYFPRMVLPIATVLTGFVNMLLSEIVVFVVLCFSGLVPTYHVIALPVVMLTQLMLVMGIVLITSALTVYFRDLAHILDIIIMVWFYITPIVYPIDILPESLRAVIHFNPMTGVIHCYRQILYYRCWPDFSTMMIAAVTGLLSIGIGLVVFQHLQKGFAEEL